MKGGGERAELTLYGDISDSSWWGDEVTPKQFKADLDALGEVAQLDIYINSGGGDVFAGNAIYNMLRRHKAHKTVYVDGLAASIASVIAMAGDKIVMPENAMLMIHNAWTIAWGNKADMRKIADEMDKIDGLIAGVYADKAGRENAEFAALMDAETWFTAEEAVAAGLADEIEAQKRVAASVDGNFLAMNGQKFDLSRYKDATKPKQIAPEGAEPPQGGFLLPDNGGESQPAADSNNALEKQRRHFSDLRKKLLEV